MHRIFVIFLILISSLGLLNAQNWNQIFSKELEAEQFLYEKRFDEAVLKYIEALDLLPRSANLSYKVGFSYLLTHNKKHLAIEYFEKAVKDISDNYDPRAIKEVKAPPEAFYLLGTAYQINNQLDKAKEAYNKYKEYLQPQDEFIKKVEMRIASCDAATHFFENRIGLKINNLGSKINDSNLNFNPVFSGDGSTMAFTRQSEFGFEVYIAKKEGNTWGEPVSIADDIRAFFLKTSFLSNDGNEIYLIDDFNSEGLIYFSRYQKGDIYYSAFEKGKWQKAKKLGKPFNTKYHESHLSISPNGQMAYFTSDRPEGLGGLDIYKSELSPKGKWGKPENLGIQVNTGYNEDTPFLTPDGKYLFFSSEGHDNMGGFDIFYVDLEADSNPVNLGYPFNNTQDNQFFFPSDLRSGYMAFNNPEGYGLKDIHQVTVLPLVNLQGRLSLSESVPIDNQADIIITVYNVEDNKIEATLNSNLNSRSFSHKLIPGIYTVALQGEGFNDYSTDVFIPEGYELPNYSLDIVLKPIIPEPVLAEVQDEAIEQELEIIAEEVQAEVTVADNFEVKDTKIKPSSSRDVVVQPKIHFESENTAYEGLYTVQIMALLVPVKVEHFSNVSGVTVIKGSDGYHRYTVGATNSIEEAKEIQNQLIKLGYKDAFIRKHQGSELQTAQFTIQIMALKNPVTIDHFTNLGAVNIEQGSDGFYRYTYGTFSSLEQAQSELTRIVSIGYKDAFTRKRLLGGM
jgi:tetratricopeptide (TPR) repeat protein